LPHVSEAKAKAEVQQQQHSLENQPILPAMSFDSYNATRQNRSGTSVNPNPGLGKCNPAKSMEVNSDLRKIQDEWEHLLSREDLLLVPLPPSLIYDQECHEKYSACALWMDDGTMGFSVDFPYDTFELKCYWLRQSKAFTKFYFLCCFLHIISPFFEEPVCPWTLRGEYAVITTEGGFFSPMLINIISLFCVLVYLLDLFLWLRVNNKHNSVTSVAFYKNGWVLIRCIISAILFLDTMVYFATGRPIRFARGLVPFVYISRRVSMRQLLQGLMLAMTKTVNVLILFTAMVFIYGYTGFLIFHNVETDKENRFESLPSAILTVLHVLAGRSYNAFVSNQYFGVHFAAGFFFVTLMIAGDFLCTNLIIAVGNRQFKIFSNHIYKRQLRNRRQALISIHEVLSDAQGHISLPVWLRFCSQIRGAIKVSPAMANVLFLLEAETDAESPHFNTLDCVGLFRLSALIAARVDLVEDGSGQQGQTDAARDKEKLEEEEERMQGRQSSMIRQKEENFLTLDVFGVDDIMSSNLFGFAPETGGEGGEDSEKEYGGGAAGGSRERTTTIELTARPSNVSIDQGPVRSAPCGHHQGSGGSAVWGSLRKGCNTFIDYNISVRQYLPFLFKKDKDILLSPFALFFSVFRVLLAVQLVKISGHNGSLPWLQVGWVVQAFLMLESLILISALGFNVYWRQSGASYSFVLNFFSLIFMIAVGSNASQQGRPVFLLLLVVQVFRFFRSFRFLRDYDFMMSLLPLIVRMLILYFSVIYFFAVLGHTRLCHTFPSDLETQEVDDDGGSWEEFSGLLNFSTLLKTIFTLYEVSILGNWSIVMGAASRKEPVLAYLFFLPYRLLMAMLVIPLLFSFIMQAFICHRDKLARKEIVVDKLATYSRFDRFCETNTEEAPVNDPEQITRSVDDAVAKIMKRNEEASASMRENRNSVRKIQRRASMRSINLSKSFMDIAEGNFFGPDISIPTLQGSGGEGSGPGAGAGAGKKAIRSGEKGQSMMSFWSGGMQGPSTLHRDQRNVEVLASMLEEALFQLGRTLDDKEDTLITLDAVKGRSEQMDLQQFREDDSDFEESDEED
jgi:hypothetical protein